MNKQPDWISKALFPFRSRFFQTEEGALHYLDEGSGPPIVFVHGNPSWSFEFRHLVVGLRDAHRCIAVDHLGFGLSDRAADPAAYHPKEHARRLGALLTHLELDAITLVVTDWGGPIGLDFARVHPERVAKIVVMNSWCWPVDDDPHFVKFSAAMSSGVVQFLIKRFNIFVNLVMPKAVGNRRALTREVMTHYRKAQGSPALRAGSMAFPAHIVGASDWLGELWGQRERFTDKPLLLLWGLKDIAFRKRELETWREAFADARIREFPDCGHFMAEEAPEAVEEEIRRFVDS